jgi:hypothetical protein
MIGSKSKVNKIFEALQQGGATEEQLAKVDSPMGIDIGSQTVEEIAISIAAELLKQNINKSFIFYYIVRLLRHCFCRSVAQYCRLNWQ